MKRENEENLQDSESFFQQQMMSNGEDGAFDESVNMNDTNNSPGPTNPPKRQRRSDDEEIRLLIPSKIAGAVIGKGGHNIQKLRTEYKAQVSIGDCQGPERVITIASDLDTCCNVIKEIMKHFDKGNADECELRILIHQSLAGCVIGKSGAKIKELKDRIGCRLKIFSNIAPQSSDRVAQVIGKEEQCIESLLEIIDLIKGTPIKGPIHNYDPHNFDDMYADEYGGYGSGMNGGSARSKSSDRGATAGRFNRNNNGSNNNNNNVGSKDRGRRFDYVDPWAHNGNGNTSFASNGNMPSLMGQNGNSFGNNNAGSMDLDGKSSTQVTIPKDLAGAIIGKGGGRIRRIRSESSAFIQIDEALPGSTDRIITITGTPKQIQMAQYMLQQSIQNGAK